MLYVLILHQDWMKDLSQPVTVAVYSTSEAAEAARDSIQAWIDEVKGPYGAATWIEECNVG
jgi:hypothetical protein